MNYRNRASTLVFRPACTERSHRLVDRCMARLVCRRPVFFGLWLIGFWPGPLVAQPRPLLGLIHVVGHPRGFAFPSIFGLLHAATFAYIALLALARLRGTLAIPITVVSALILLIGACARIVLGAHWPRALRVAFLIGLFWIELLLPASGRGTSRPGCREQLERVTRGALQAQPAYRQSRSRSCCENERLLLPFLRP